MQNLDLKLISMQFYLKLDFQNSCALQQKKRFIAKLVLIGMGEEFALRLNIDPALLLNLEKHL